MRLHIRHVAHHLLNTIDFTNTLLGEVGTSNCVSSPYLGTFQD